MRLARYITLRQLEVFVEAARALNFSRAAAKLHLTQPAVSMQIRQLEQSAGLPLFDQVGRRKVLTDAGTRLLAHASRVLGELDDAGQSLEALKGLAGGSITVGLVSTAQYFAPRLVAQFLEQHAAVRVDLVLGNRETLVRWLKENRIDLAVMGRPPAEVDTLAQPLAPNPHAVVAGPAHALARARRVQLRQLAGETFLQREAGSGTRSVMEELFRGERFAPARLVTLATNEAIKQAVMAGLGLSVVSLHTVGLEQRAGAIAVLHLHAPTLDRTWHVVHARRRQLSPAATAFRTFLLAHAYVALRAAKAGSLAE